MKTMTRRERAKAQYDAATTHGEVVDAFERALIYKEALKEIDTILTGSLPVTAEVKEIIKAALEERLTAL